MRRLFALLLAFPLLAAAYDPPIGIPDPGVVWKNLDGVQWHPIDYVIPAYTKYVDRTASNCNDAGPGTAAVPLCNYPNPIAAGEVVEVHGGCYPVGNKQILTITFAGSLTQPGVLKWVNSGLCNQTTAQNQWGLPEYAGSYGIIDGEVNRHNRTAWVGHHLSVRNGDYGWAARQLMNFEGQNIVAYNNRTHHAMTDDKHGWYIGGAGDLIWVLNGLSEYNQGNCWQFRNNNAGVDYLPTRVFIGGNTWRYCKETGGGIKNGAKIVLSQNESYGAIKATVGQYFTLPDCSDPGYAQYNFVCGYTVGSGGGGAGYGLGIGVDKYPKETYVVANYLHSNEGPAFRIEESDDTWVANNILEGDGAEGYRGEKRANNGKYWHFCNNTIVGRNPGEYTTWFSTNGEANQKHFNNIYTGYDAAAVIFFADQLAVDDPLTEFRYNLAWEYLNGNVMNYGWRSSQIRTLNSTAEMNSQLPTGGGTSNNKYGNPLFVDFNNKNYALQAGSPAIDAGTDCMTAMENAYQTSFGPYATTLRRDFNNKPIPLTNVDMGAIQLGSSCSQSPAFPGIPDPAGTYTGTEFTGGATWPTADPCGQQAPPAPPSWTDTGSGTSATAGYYYVCPSCAGASNSNTYGHPQAPRVTHPDPIPAGAKVYYSGIIDAANFLPSSNWRFVSQGTQANPVWLIGLPGNEFRTRLELESGGYLFTDNLNFSASTNGNFALLASGNISHVAIKNSIFKDSTNFPGVTLAFLNSSASISNILIQGNTFLRLGNWQNTADTNDYGVSMATLNATTTIQNVWMLDNNSSYLGMSSYLINGGSFPDSIKNIFIANNRSHHNRVSGGTVSSSRSVVVSKNEVYEMRNRGGLDSGSCLITSGSPKNVWFLDNYLHHCDLGIHQGTTSADADGVITALNNYLDNIQFRQPDTAANAATNADGTPGSGASRYSELSCPTAAFAKAFDLGWGNNPLRILQNTIRNSTIDFYTNSNDRLDIHGNIFGAPVSGAACYELDITGIAVTADKFSIDYNQFENTSLASRLSGVSHTSLANLSNALSTGSGKCLNCQAGDPLFTVDDLVSGLSPVIDQSNASILTNNNGVNSTYQICADYLAQYGIDICFDRVGVVRPLGSNWDIGSREVSGTADTTPPSVTQLLPTTTQTGSFLIDVTFNEAVTGVDVTDFALSDTGCSGASLGALTAVSSSRYQLPVTGASDGSCTVTLTSDANDIEDAAGNDMNPASAATTFNIVTAVQSTLPRFMFHLFREQ